MPQGRSPLAIPSRRTPDFEGDCQSRTIHCRRGLVRLPSSRAREGRRERNGNRGRDGMREDRDGRDRDENDREESHFEITNRSMTVPSDMENACWKPAI